MKFNGCRGRRVAGERWKAAHAPNPPIEPNPELEQQFQGIGPAWLVVAGVAGLVFIFLYIRMVS